MNIIIYNYADAIYLAAYHIIAKMPLYGAG